MPRTSRRRSTASLAGLVALTAALAGCGELVVLNPGSLATCVPDGDPVTLTTSQDASGEQLTITYEGPSDLAVVFSYGYSLEDIPEAAATGAYAYSQSTSSQTADAGTAYLLRLDPATDSGWTSFETDGILEATFEGNIDELLDGRDAYLALNQGTSIAEVAAAFVAVNCDTEFTSGEVETVDSDPALAPDLLLAAPLNPDTVRLGPFVITEQTTVEGVTTGKLRFAADAAETLGDFVPSTIAESRVLADIADVPNDTFSQLWFQEFIRDAQAVGFFQITSSLSLTDEMDFTLTSATAPEPLPAGVHRLRLVLGNTDLILPFNGVDSVSSELTVQQVRDLDPRLFTPAAAGDAKAAFWEIEYDEVTGLRIGAAAGADDAEPELADTGSAAVESLAGLVALLIVAGGALIVVRRVRRA
ncbi:MAG: hypothetical protein Q7J04_05445 [Microcella sp.]|nr:hypothetical protein [Microcella sp.]